MRMTMGTAHKREKNVIERPSLVPFNDWVISHYTYIHTHVYIHICIEESFGLCGRGRGWDDLGEWHWNMYIIICEMNHQARFDAWYRVLGAGALGWPRGTGWGGRCVWGFRMGNTCTPMADSCQCMAKPIQYCKVISLQLKKINLYLKKERKKMYVCVCVCVY